MQAIPRLLLIVALLHAQTPCGAAFGSPAPCACRAEQLDTTPPACDCGCCEADPADVPMDVSPSPTDDGQPCEPTGCPANCPCAVCSAGYIPLTDLTSVILPVATAFGPPLLPADPSGGQAGHRQLPDRPPRLV
jgi:hypothetical protein